MSINQQSKVWINKPPWPTPSLIWISMFMSMLMSIFIYRRPPCLMYMFLMYKLTDKAHERIKEKVYVNPTWANQNQNPGVIQTDELKWLVAQLHSDRGGDLPNMLFCIFLHPYTPVLIPPVHLLWVGDARLWCSSGHDRPLPLSQEGLHFVIILRSQRTLCIKPKMKQR